MPGEDVPGDDLPGAGVLRDLAGVDEDLELARVSLYRDATLVEDLLRRAQRALGGLRDPARMGRVLELRGELLLTQGRLDEAAASLRNARRYWLAAGRELDAFRAQLALAMVRLSFGEYDEVLRSTTGLQSSLDQFASIDTSEIVRLQAAFHVVVGEASAGRGETAEALRRYDVAEDLARSVGDSVLAATAALRRGESLTAAGLPARGADELARARASFERLGFTFAAEYAAIRLAAAWSCTGDLAGAFALLEQVADRKQLQPAGWAWHGLARADVLIRAGLAAEAHSAATTAEQLAAELGMSVLTALSTLACAAASLQLRRPDRALQELSAAERIFDDCGARGLLDMVRVVRAQVELDTDRPTAAAATCRRLLAGGADERSPGLAIRARLLLARAGALVGTTADNDCELLINEAAERSAALGRPEFRIDLAFARAQCDRRAGRLRQAADDLRDALVRRSAWDPVAAVPVSGIAGPSLLEIGEQLIDVLLEIGDHAATIEAWQRMCAVKLGGFGPLVRRTAGWRPFSGRGPGGDVPGPGPDAAMPVHANALPKVPVGPVIDYYVLGPDVVCFVVREGQVHVRRLVDATDPTREAVLGWRQECRLIAATGASASLSSPSLELLHQLLIAPLEDLLDGQEDDEDASVTIVGHRHLHGVPFEALVDGAGEPNRAPRPAALSGTEPEQAPLSAHEHAPLLVLAVPDEEAPLIRAEATMIKQLLPGSDVLIGEEATQQRLVERASSVGLVHIACHATFRAGNPLFSALRLADGWVRAADLVASPLRLNGAVVVLSACSSGGVSEITAEPLGLAWSFLEAGASGVVASLWDTDDSATLELMTHLYRGLASGEDPRSALRAATRAVAAHQPHPYHWAPFRYFALPGGLQRS